MLPPREGPPDETEYLRPRGSVKRVLGVVETARGSPKGEDGREAAEHPLERQIAPAASLLRDGEIMSASNGEVLSKATSTGHKRSVLSHRIRDQLTPARLVGANMSAVRLGVVSTTLQPLQPRDGRQLHPEQRSLGLEPAHASTGGSTKRNSGLGGGGGNTQAAVRTKRQQTGRRGGTPSTCCLVAQ